MSTLLHEFMYLLNLSTRGRGGQIILQIQSTQFVNGPLVCFEIYDITRLRALLQLLPKVAAAS